MSNEKDSNTVSVLIVGAGPAGLAAAIQLKLKKPALDVCVIDKAAALGSHNLSGAVLGPQPLTSLLNSASPGWQDTEQAKDIFANRVQKQNFLFLQGSGFSLDFFPALKIARLLRLNIAQMIHTGDFIVSISKLTQYLGRIAKALGVEIFTGLAADDIILDSTGWTVGIKLVDQGLDKSGQKMPNFVAGEIINATFFILAEGCDGLVTEKFIQKANLTRQSPQLYSVGIKEIIKVTPEQYENFSPSRIVYTLGYPLWTPARGPAVFGGGIIYPAQKDHLALGIIAGADWKYCDFNPQEALVRLKDHKFTKKYIENGTVVEAGAKMIPEAGLYAVPRDPSGHIGRLNCLIVGDAAGFVNMLQMKGLHNAIDSGIQAAKAVLESLSYPKQTASRYTTFVNCSNIAKELDLARNFRQTVARLGLLVGLPLSALANKLPKFKVDEDYKALTSAKYRFRLDRSFDKDTFTALAGTNHREEQPSHLSITNRNTCAQKCTPRFNCPCIVFCPAGVYEKVAGTVTPAHPSNCLHCKTCQRKCPFDNIRWTAPEGAGGPKYKSM